MTEITTLAPADRAMIVLSSSTTEAQLRGMVQDAASITDVIDPDGREQAHRMGMKLRTARTTIEKAGKVDRKAVAQALHGLKVSAAKHPGVLMDVAMEPKLWLWVLPGYWVARKLAI